MKGKNVPSLWCEQYQIEPPMSGPTWQQLDKETWPSVSPTWVISVGSNRGQKFHPTFLVTKKWNKAMQDSDNWHPIFPTGIMLVEPSPPGSSEVVRVNIPILHSYPWCWGGSSRELNFHPLPAITGKK